MSKHKLYRVAYTEYAKGYFEVSALDDAHLEQILENLDELADNKSERDYGFDLGQIEEIGISDE
jgi:uncharacterized membrane protein YukC